MTRLSAALVAGLLVLSTAAAQEAPRYVVMNLAAHPDDEDGATLAAHRGALGADAVSVVFTRGEGGQNEAGTDLYERLGAVRTRETEAASRVLGTRLRFLNRYDFGFSKSYRETFAAWSRSRTTFWDTRPPVPETPATIAAGRDSTVARLVAMIRRFRPDVLFTNHDTLTVWPAAQHGHHQAVALAAVDAFRLAADPAFHPEQLADPALALWQPQRLFVRTGAWGRAAGRVDAAIPVGDACAATAVRPAEPCSERAVAAAALHVSQGFDKFADRFRRDTTYFTLLLAADGAPPLPHRASSLTAGLSPTSRPALDPPEGARLPTLAGLTAEPAVAVPGQRVRLAWPAQVGTLVVAPAHADAASQALDLQAGRGSVVVPVDAPITLPMHERMYDRADSRPPVRYTVVDADGAAVAAGALPVETSPGVGLDLDPSPRRLVAGLNPVTVRYAVHMDGVETLQLALVVLDEAGEPVAFTIEDVPAGASEATLSVRLPDGVAAGRYRLVAEERSGACGTRWVRVERPAAVLPAVAVAPGLRVGFVRSYDGTTADALAAMGADVVDLDSTALATSDFAGLHTVWIDIRAFLDRGDLRAHNGRLLDWVARGGHVVVGYHKTFEWNPAEAADPILGASLVPAGGWAPVPLALSRDRVTREDAAVTALRPDHPLLNAPYAITPADWDGWVQERGLYFPAEDTDARYERLLSMHDPGEAPLTTGLLVAHVGRGTYVYSPLGWYRQLEALTPGAWRIVANLVSLPLVDGRAPVATAPAERSTPGGR